MRISILFVIHITNLEHSDIQWIIRGLRRVSFNWVKRDSNWVAHVLSIYARNLNEDIYWMEDAPPVALEATYQDSFLMNT